MVYPHEVTRDGHRVRLGGYQFTANGEDFHDGTTQTIHQALLEMSRVYRDRLRYTPFRYFAYRDGGGALRQDTSYQELEDDPTIIHMALLNFGLERRVIDTRAMLEDARRHYRFQQERAEELQERLT